MAFLGQMRGDEGQVGEHEGEHQAGETEGLDQGPHFIAELEGEYDIETGTKRKEQSPGDVDAPPQGLRQLDCRMSHALHQHRLADEMAAGQHHGEDQVDRGRFELDEERIVDAQGQAAQDQGDHGGAEVHAMQASFGHAIPQHQEKKRGDQDDRGEIDVAPQDGAQECKGGKRINPFVHPPIILPAPSTDEVLHPANMSAEFFPVHPVNPNVRQIRQIVERLRGGAIMAYPTDSCYALGCQIGDKQAFERIERIRGQDKRRNMTLMCADLAEISAYAKLDNWQFRMLKHATPGPYTFILRASHQVPRRLQTGKRKTIGVRVPENAIAHALLEHLGEPILSCTAQLPGETDPFHSADDILELLDRQLDLIVDGGSCGFEPTTVIDLSGDQPEVIRTGKGALGALGL